MPRDDYGKGKGKGKGGYPPPFDDRGEPPLKRMRPNPHDDFRPRHDMGRPVQPDDRGPGRPRRRPSPEYRRPPSPSFRDLPPRNLPPRDLPPRDLPLYRDQWRRSPSPPASRPPRDQLPRSPPPGYSAGGSPLEAFESRGARLPEGKGKGKGLGSGLEREPGWADLEQRRRSIEARERELAEWENRLNSEVHARDRAIQREHATATARDPRVAARDPRVAAPPSARVTPASRVGPSPVALTRPTPVPATVQRRPEPIPLSHRPELVGQQRAAPAPQRTVMAAAEPLKAMRPESSREVPVRRGIPPVASVPGRQYPPVDIRHQEVRHQEVRHQEVRHQEVRHQEVRRQEVRHQEVRHQQPQTIPKDPVQTLEEEIAALHAKNDTTAMLRVYGRARSNGLRPSPQTYVYLLSALALTVDTAAMEKVYGELLLVRKGSRSVSPLTPQACHDVIFALSESHLRPRVMQLYAHLKQIGSVIQSMGLGSRVVWKRDGPAGALL